MCRIQLGHYPIIHQKAQLESARMTLHRAGLQACKYRRVAAVALRHQHSGNVQRQVWTLAQNHVLEFLRHASQFGGKLRASIDQWRAAKARPRSTFWNCRLPPLEVENI